MSKTRRTDPAAILRKLTRAALTGHLVRLHRTIDGTDPVEGFVLGAAPGWTLLAECRDLRLDGFTALRTTDLARVRKRGGPDSLTVRALRRHGRWPVAVPPMALDDLPTLLADAHQLHGLLSVHLERETTEALWIGAVTRVGRKNLHLHQIDPEARWHDHPSKFPLAEITRVTFGSHYERTLAEFAEAPPGQPELPGRGRADAGSTGRSAPSQ
ncbi:hypothetical protein ACIA8O_07615 [Kitasatospora sp. NPDC051853]|uniref:hypothetical protein n=1 Tax=Kitasatospora sp. NPDC051853 TaxID=3364058 RepID=UPI0037B848DC